MNTLLEEHSVCVVCGAYADSGGRHQSQTQPTCDRCGSLIAVAAEKQLQFYPTWRSMLAPRNVVKRLVGRLSGKRG